MVDPDRSRENRQEHRRRPSVEALEGRQLLTTASQNAAYRVARVSHEYHEFVSKLQQIELRSQATPAQYLAVRDDARAISDAASSTSLAPQAADEKALVASLQLDRAPLEGWVGDAGWAEIRTRLATNLDGLNVPPALIDQTIADMRALATSAGVTSDEYQAYTNDFDRLRDGEASLRSSYVHFPDPGLYYTQHLRGFFRGGAVQRNHDQAKLDADLRAIRAEAHAPPAVAATLPRDARLLEQIGAGVTTEANAQIIDAYVGAFLQGPPSPSALATAQAGIVDALGNSATTASLSATNRLIADAPAFYQAAGASIDNIRTITDDVKAIVADGGGSPLNPFKVEIARPPRSPNAG